MNLTIFTIILLTLSGCQLEPAIPDCPVTYLLDKTHNYTLNNNWKLVGIKSGSAASIEYPPCVGYDHYKERYVFTLSFKDTVNHSNDTGFMKNHVYAFSYTGQTVVNGFGGSYHIDDSSNITFGECITQLVGYSSVEIKNYCSRYSATLSNAKRFSIQNNLLTIYGKQSEEVIFVVK